MAGQEDIELVRRGYEAFAAGDMQWMNDHLADDVIWHTPGNNPGAGDFKGKEEVLGSFARIAQATQGTLRLDVHDVTGSDQHVVGLVMFSAQSPDGDSIKAHFANVFHVENGKAKEVWGMVEDGASLDAFLNKLTWP
jgi:ketosteroid isomerase-like protein